MLFHVRHQNLLQIDLLLLVWRIAFIRAITCTEPSLLSLLLILGAADA